MSAMSQRLAGTAALLLFTMMAGCGGDDADQDGSGGSTANSGQAEVKADPAVGKKFCTAIKAVQADLQPDAKSAAYLAQLTLKTDAVENAKLSAAVVDKSTKSECPTEYQKFLEQADITSLRDVGLQP